MAGAKEGLVIWGASGQAAVIVDIIRLKSEYEIIGFIDDLDPERHGTEFCGAPVLGGAEQLERLQSQGIRTLIMGFGNSRARLRLAALARSKGYRLATAIHPHTSLGMGASVGPGTVIKAGAAIDPLVRIGENVIVGSCVSIGHHAVLEDGVRINAGARVSGYATIGKAATIGTGALIRDRVHIGEYCFVGMGAAVIRDIPDRVVAYGVPAKVRRAITPEAD